MGISDWSSNVCSSDLAETLAANPANQALRTTFLYNINEVVTAFQQTANDLQALSESVGSAGSISISAINDALTELTRVNEGLREVESGTSAEAQLLDSRDGALSALRTQRDVKNIGRPACRERVCKYR